MGIQLRNPSKRQQIRDGILELIRREGLKPGDQILSQSRLAKAFRVNPLTVGKALEDLCAENLIYRENGRGTFVGPPVTTTRVRKICLTVPRDNIDSPTDNPGGWQYAQHWYRSFMLSMDENMTFSSVLVPVRDTSAATVDKLREFDLVYFLTPEGYEDLIQLMLNRNVSCPVFYGHPVEGLNCLSFRVDFGGDIRVGITHLAAQGRRKIALLCSSASWFDPVDGMYREAMELAGLPVRGDWVFRGDGDYAETFRRMDAEGPFDAVFAMTTQPAMLLLDHLNRAGVSVPGTTAVMADQGVEFLTRQPPYLTSVMHPQREMIRFSLDFIEQHGWMYRQPYHRPFIGHVLDGRTT